MPAPIFLEDLRSPLFGNFWGPQPSWNNKVSHFHALISLSKNIRKNLDEGNIGCSIFVDLKKAFDIVKHDSCLSKLEHYDGYGLPSEWFKSYRIENNVSINGYDSNLAIVTFLNQLISVINI